MLDPTPQDQLWYAFITLGVFFSVFLLTRTGLSYFSSDEFGGIMLYIIVIILVQFFKLNINLKVNKIDEYS